MKSTLAIAAMATASILALSSENAHANEALRKQPCFIIERGQGRFAHNKGCLIDSSMLPQGRVGWVVTRQDGSQFRIEDDDSDMWRMDGKPAERTQDNSCYQNDRVEVCLVNGTFGATDDLLCEHQKRALKNTFSELVSELARVAAKRDPIPPRLQEGMVQARFQEGMAFLDRVGHDNVTLGKGGPVADKNCARAFELADYAVYYGESAHANLELPPAPAWTHVREDVREACSITDRGAPPLHLPECLIASIRSPEGRRDWVVTTPQGRRLIIERFDSRWRLGDSFAEQTEGGRCYQSNDVAVCVENGASWPAPLP